MGRDAWVRHKLADLMDVKHGFAFAGEHIKDAPPGDILLTPGNFAVGGGFKGDKHKYFDGPVPDDYVLHEDDLIVTMTDLSKQADTLGFSALVPRPGPMRFLHNQRLGKVLIREGAEVDKHFLTYLLRTPEYRHEILAGATGTTVKHTSPGRILAYKASFPPLPEQRAIAHILRTLDDKIELNRRMNETLEGMARALFQSWFVDFDPVHRNIQRAQGHTLPSPTSSKAKSAADPLAEFDALFPDAFEDSELGPIPRGWRVVPLDCIAEFLNGLALQKFPPGDGPSLPVIKIAQLRAGTVSGADRASMSIPDRYHVHDGDVVFSWSGSLECVLWAGGQGALNQHLFKVSSPEYPKWFYYQWVHQHLSDFRLIAAGKATTMGHIQRHHLTDARVNTPTRELLTVMTPIIEPLVESQWKRTVESRTLAALRDTLLPKLISGELRVKDAEKFVEGAV